jgi:hypothetical protein
MAKLFLERLGALGATEPEAAGKPGLKGFPDDQPTVEDAIQCAWAWRTTVEPIGGWRIGRKGEPAPKRLGAAEKVNPDDLAERRRREPRCFGTEVSPPLGSGHREVESKNPARRECLL